MILSALELPSNTRVFEFSEVIEHAATTHYTQILVIEGTQGAANDLVIIVIYPFTQKLRGLNNATNNIRYIPGNRT